MMLQGDFDQICEWALQTILLYKIPKLDLTGNIVSGDPNGLRYLLNSEKTDIAEQLRTTDSNNE